MSKSVNVLCPNGHRVSIKVTPSSPILEILERVCSKKGFEAEIHELRHHNKTLDNSSSVQFTGLPNNAQLELVRRSERKKDDEIVTVGFQLESGKRLLGDFMPNTSLMTIIDHWRSEIDDFPPDASSSEPVVVYMRREIVGKDNLEKTSLRNLGLTSGKAVLRFFFKEPEALKTQAGVCDVKETKREAQEPAWVPMKRDEPRGFLKKVEIPEEETKIEMESTKIEVESTKIEAESTETVETQREVEEKELEKELEVDLIKEEKLLVKDDDEAEMDVEEEESEPPIVHYLDEERSLAYDGSRCSGNPSLSNLDDNFFELDISDVKKLYRDQKRAASEFQEGEELLTAEIRREREEAKRLSILNKYRKTVVRVHFPEDRLIFQSVFLSGQTIADVKDRLRKFLEFPDIKFDLFVAPPKKVLSPSSSLLDCELVPAAKVHFSSNSKNSLNDFVRNQLSNSTGAENALKSSGVIRRRTAEMSELSSELSLEAIVTGGPSTLMMARQPETSKRTQTSPSTSGQKVPKWFKPGK